MNTKQACKKCERKTEMLRPVRDMAISVIVQWENGEGAHPKAAYRLAQAVNDVVFDISKLDEVT